MKSRKVHQDDSRQLMESPQNSGMNEHVSMPPLLLTLPQVAQQLGLSLAKVYNLVTLEGLPTVKFGRSTRVSYVSLVHWVKERESEQRAC
jgi:excisionase family DNA binding protein